MNTSTCPYHAHGIKVGMGQMESLTFDAFSQRDLTGEGHWKCQKEKNKFNIIIPFLSTTKQALADSPQTSLWEAELLFILDVYSCMTHQGKNKCVDSPICYNNCRHCSAQLLLGSACLVENKFISAQVRM